MAAEKSILEEDVSLDLLTDEAIIDYTTDNDNGMVFNHIINDSRDLNLRNNPFEPYPGGLFDVDIFGSCLRDRCICGNIKHVSDKPCPFCGCRVYSPEENCRRFGRIELPFYYLNDLRFDLFKELFDEVFSNTEIKLRFANPDLKAGGYSNVRGTKKLGIKVFDSCQFDYSKTKNQLVISEFITDESKSSYEGLIKIFDKYFPESSQALMKMINKYYLVLPTWIRPFTLDRKGGKQLGTSKFNTWYSIIVRFCSKEDMANKVENYNKVMATLQTPGERVKYTAVLRALLNSGKHWSTELLNSSKKNLAREMYSVRTKNSARCPITPSTTLKIDEIELPRHIAYETCRSGFCKALQEEYGFTPEQAKISTEKEYDNPEIQKKFKEYAEKQVAILIRQPVLHEYGALAMKIKISDEQPYDPVTGKTLTGNVFTIGLPIAVCSPFNADFDGDTMSLHLVPEDVKEDILHRMSPRYVNIYKKNLKPIYVPDHEVLNGLAVLTEVKAEPGEVDDPREFYDSWSDLVRDCEMDNKITINKPIRFTGNLGGVDYRDKKTTYGRLKISKIIEADVDFVPIWKNKPESTKMFTERMNADSGARLYQFLYPQPDGVEKIQKLQKAALKAVTKAGVVTFDFNTLYADTNTETYKKMRSIADSKELSDQQKMLLLTEEYEKYNKEIEGSYSDGLKDELSMANRVKLSSIAAMTMPQFIISGVNEVPILNKGTLLTGLTEKEYMYHAIENRSLLTIKQSGTPASGYLTRQLTFLMNNYKFKDGEEDPKNACILIPRYRARGRMAPNGIRYQEAEYKNPDESDLVEVRSIITKRKNRDIVTPDCISSRIIEMTGIHDGDGIGTSFGSSLTEATTQGVLALKHGGHERVLDVSGELKCPDDNCTLKEEGRFLILENSKNTYKFPKPANLVLVPSEKFNKGDIIGTAYNTVSPISSLNAEIKLLKASKGSKTARYFEKDNVLINDCYAYEEGEIHYKENKDRGYIEVWIGNKRYDYNDKCIYYFPEGTLIKKHQRFCNGVENMGHVTADLGNNIRDIYSIFRKQFYYLQDQGFDVKSPTLSGKAVSEELIEMLFASLINVTYDDKDVKIKEVEYLGTQGGIMNSGSFYTMLSYGNSSKVVSDAIKGKTDIKNDIMTETILGLVLGNNLDDKFSKI